MICISFLQASMLILERDCEGMARPEGADLCRFTSPLPKHCQWWPREILQKAAHVCAICDDGGDLTMCDGPCVRHFHLNRTSKGAAENRCPGVGLAVDHDGDWECPDCALKLAQCAMCGVRGRREGVPLQLRKCTDLFCVRFYCFQCLPEEAGTCPLHICKTCGLADGPSWDDWVACPRCPTGWHVQCLKDSQVSGYESERHIYYHASDGVRRAFFYCHRHRIEADLETPKRDHISWFFDGPSQSP